jgi:hypothetical protein
MIRAEHIPDEVYDAVGIPKWQAQAYLLAMLNAWPQAQGLPKVVNDKLQWGNNTHVMLPLKEINE